MFGDFSRDSFDACRQYTRVLMQQGRPLTDADWNEQVSALWHHIHALGAATIGWHGSPDKGFCINQNTVFSGSYFIDGIRCVNDAEFQLLDLVLKSAIPSNRLLYLDLWEHTANAIEDPSQLEPALQGIDTANRTRIEWALRYTADDWPSAADPNSDVDAFRSAINDRTSPPPALIVRRANARPSSGPCQIDSGLVRQNAWTDRLYRVEIHKTGKGTTKVDISNKLTDGKATFKWSRDNGSVIAAIQPDPSGAAIPSSPVLQLDRTKFSSRTPFQKGAFVELIAAAGWPAHNVLVQLTDTSSTTLNISKAFPQTPTPPMERVVETSMGIEKSFYYLRQWDPTPRIAGVVPLQDPNPLLADDGAAFVLAEKDVWLELEDGLQIQFSTDEKAGNDYREGDYWLFRTTADGQVILLPGSVGQSSITTCGMPPRGRHHFAPIGMKTTSGGHSDFRGERLRPIGHRYETTNLPTTDCPPCRIPASVSPQTPDSVPARSGSTPAGTPNPNGCCGTLTQVSLPLSRDGTIALRGYFGATRNLARHFPARFLQYEPKSPTYRRFRSPLLVSDILESSFEKYLAKVERCVQVTESERPLVDADARADYEQATQFQSGVSADDRFTSPIA